MNRMTLVEAYIDGETSTEEINKEIKINRIITFFICTSKNISWKYRAYKKWCIHSFRHYIFTYIVHEKGGFVKIINLAGWVNAKCKVQSAKLEVYLYVRTHAVRPYGLVVFICCIIAVLLILGLCMEVANYRFSTREKIVMCCGLSQHNLRVNNGQTAFLRAKWCRETPSTFAGRATQTSALCWLYARRLFWLLFSRKK